MVPYVLAFPGEPQSTSPEQKPIGKTVFLLVPPIAEEVFVGYSGS